MSRLRALLVVFVALALIAGPLGVPGQATASGDAPASTSAKKNAKKKCKKLKGKKKKKCLKQAKKAKGKGGKPWAGSPYKPGQTCELTKKKQKEYAKYGLFCLDISADFYLTTLVPLKG